MMVKICEESYLRRRKIYEFKNDKNYQQSNKNYLTDTVYNK